MRFILCLFSLLFILVGVQQSFGTDYFPSGGYSQKAADYEYAYGSPHRLVDDYICDLDASILVVTNSEKQLKGSSEPYGTEAYGNTGTNGHGDGYGTSGYDGEYGRKTEYDTKGDTNTKKEEYGAKSGGYVKREVPQTVLSSPSPQKANRTRRSGKYDDESESDEYENGYKRSREDSNEEQGEYGSSEGSHGEDKRNYASKGHTESYGYDTTKKGYGGGGGAKKYDGSYGGEEKTYGTGYDAYGKGYSKNDYGNGYGTEKEGYGGETYGKKGGYYNVAKAHRLRCSAIAVNSDADCLKCCHLAARKERSISKKAIIGFIVDYDEMRQPTTSDYQTYYRRKRSTEQNTAKEYGKNNGEYGVNSDYGNGGEYAKTDNGVNYPRKPKNVRCVCCAPKTYKPYHYGRGYGTENHGYGGGYGKSGYHGYEQSGYGESSGYEDRYGRYEKGRYGGYEKGVYGGYEKGEYGGYEKGGYEVGYGGSGGYAKNDYGEKNEYYKSGYNGHEYEKSEYGGSGGYGKDEYGKSGYGGYTDEQQQYQKYNERLKY